MIRRKAAIKLLDLAGKFKVVSLTGPRQSGKTTLAKAIFPEKPYVSLENMDTREFAISDPRGFLKTYEKGAIFDEVQRVPQLFSYLQEMIDLSQEKGRFILTGSNQFLLQESITQSLAGRVGSITLLPFSVNELNSGEFINNDDNELMLNGFYPPVYDQKIPPTDWYPNYIRTYIERDVRQIKDISSLLAFERFIRLLAARNGQEINFSSLGVEAGLDSKTIQSWIGILESSYIIYLLKPYYKNFNKTIVKRPKLYFYDTGIVCSLLGIRETEQLSLHAMRGSIFEGMVITEIVKNYLNKGINPPIFYWRDKAGHEIDLIIEDLVTIAYEIKSGSTIQNEYFKNLNYWQKTSKLTDCKLLYAGDLTQSRENGMKVMNWRKEVE